MELTRVEIQKVADCPVCGAVKGKPCTKRGKPRKSIHHERQKRAQSISRGIPQRAKPHKARPKKNDGFYASWEWNGVRYEALRMHGQRCQCCGWRPGDTAHGRLVVDHIKPRSKFPELELEVSNLQVLCDACNRGKSNVFTDDFRDLEHWLAAIAREE